jgi:hypothetical protein
VHEDRLLPAKRLEEQHMQRRRGHPLFPAQNVRDLHQMVVHHHRQVIGGQPVAFEQHRVDGDALVLHRDVAAHVHPDRCVPLQRGGKADDRGAALCLNDGALAGVSHCGGGGHRVSLFCLRSSSSSASSCSSDRPCRASTSLLGVCGIERLALALHIGAKATADIRGLRPNPAPASAARASGWRLSGL